MTVSWFRLRTGQPFVTESRDLIVYSVDNSRGKVQNVVTDSSEEKKAPPREPEYRIWQDASGKFKIKAEYVSYGVGKVKLRKEDGSEITVSVDKLSEEDQKWIEERKKRRS